VNGDLENQPELVNEDPWQKGWMIAITPAGSGDLDKLMDAGAYEKHVAESAH
jgi:glycine cleavage system H protein